MVAIVAAASSVGGPVLARSAGAATPAAASNAAPNGCDVLDAKECLFPFPDDYFTVSDPSTVTGRRVDFPRSVMPQNQAGIPIDPSAWDHNDGFSPGSAVLTFVPGLDLARTGAAPVTDLGASLRPDAPIVLFDATSRRRVPYWAELDQSVPNNDQRSLLVHPAINFSEGHRIVVALRRLKTATGAAIPARSAFGDYRDHVPTTDPAIEARRAHFESIFATLGDAGVSRHDLYLAWDFTIASAHNLAGPMLDMRDDAFASLDQHAPAFHIDAVTPSTDPRVASVVTGTYTVPSYLTGTGAPGSRLNLNPAGVP